ncbi:capping protein inhibiting regulator of actin dynamics [Takifugu rubripes]|uniref:capping protein inhibiting regulator of actin dynamics n=1 Tax=Takifugu rubripes TaxID=31033 RepID=UPI0011460CE7|nr:cancer-related regulator of actin dynamics [Takifugu rubripes]XP_029684223.1 cancer-related regulator of actin dynamics [Takifugu rubripes]XP_029684224.1 cancer-related regulator of actin dynamics [Takifugu rubripes]
MSQENVSDKVRNLQKQIAQGIKFGQRPPSLRKSEEDEGSTDEDDAPQSPLKVLAQVEPEPSNTESKVYGTQQVEPHSTPVKSPRTKCALPPTGTIESINLDALPQSAPRLDNAAAKHKLSVKPKNQRISRKHRRFTQDLQEVSTPGTVQEDFEAAGFSSNEQRRASADECLESLKKQRVQEEERQNMRRKREEEKRLKQEEEQRKRVEEELRLRELDEERCRKKLQEEADRRREEEERKLRENEERRQREEEEKRRIKEEEVRRQREEDEKRRLEEQRRKEEEERRKREEEEEARRQQELEAARKRKLKEEEERKRKEEAQRLKELEQKKEAEERMRKEEEEQRRLSIKEADEISDPQERKRRAEELRWKEMEERQRPFSFKVSSGEKQILFQKVNLSPVTPSPGTSGAAAEQRESIKASYSEGPDSPNLPTSPYVPHTAILVTGAQLCGTAVHLDQIKDSACKSLLGVGEDRKAQGTPPAKIKTSPDRKSGKTKSLTEASFSTDPSGSAVLAEWASIRSKIFKGVEEGKYDEYPDPSKNPPQPGSEDPPAFSHVNLRKTMSASAKFSITPAKKKFGDSNRNSDLLGADEGEAGEDAPPFESPTSASSPASAMKPLNRTSKTVRIQERGSEECMFAKDLPSFLVPSHGAKPEGVELKGRTLSETEASNSGGEENTQGLDPEDNPSPFGIKLRRTNYSLRFHSEQSTEKRKKRYSAGDSFDGVPSPLTPIEPDADLPSSFSNKSPRTSPQKEGAGKYLPASASPAVPRAKPGKPSSPVTHSDGEKSLSKSLLYNRPATSPKPVGALPTPPPSPLPKVAHGPSSGAALQRTSAAESSSQRQQDRSKEPSAVEHPHRSGHGQVQLEEEPKEKRSFFPSINIPWREKVDRKTELIRREKPSLQSRHSLDSSRVQEKDKETGPLWITLALQKQKGFREQQQSRDERRSQREAKLAEKQTRDSVPLMSPTDSKGCGSTSPSSKPQTPDEPKRPDSLLGRFERREQMKKANTLPSSVTVEIADSTPSPPAVKDMSKRFPSSDSPQVSTEPAWLALAKRKAKAWSDCPQIIK